MLFAFSFTLFKEDIALRLCRWVLVSQGQRIGPDLRKRREERKKERSLPSPVWGFRASAADRGDLAPRVRSTGGVSK